MTFRTARALLYSAIALAPFVPLVWLTAAIVSDMLATTTSPAGIRSTGRVAD